MDRANFKEKIDSMMPDLTEAIRKECIRLFNSGAVDAGEYPDNFLLPKIILSVAIENQVGQYKPFAPAYEKDYKNLRKF